MGRSLRRIVERECASYGLAVPALAIEPGRGIVGPGTVTVYEVGTVKPVEGLRTFVSVDGGMSDNIRTALYDADYTVALASRRSSAPADAGPGRGQALRERRHRRQGRVAAGRRRARVTCSQLRRPVPTAARWPATYNHVPRPPVVAVTARARTVLLRRETVEDLLVPRRRA